MINLFKTIKTSYNTIFIADLCIQLGALITIFIKNKYFPLLASSNNTIMTFRPFRTCLTYVIICITNSLVVKAYSYIISWAEISRANIVFQPRRQAIKCSFIVKSYHIVNTYYVTRFVARRLRLQIT